MGTPGLPGFTAAFCAGAVFLLALAFFCLVGRSAIVGARHVPCRRSRRPPPAADECRVSTPSGFSPGLSACGLVDGGGGVSSSWVG